MRWLIVAAVSTDDKGQTVEQQSEALRSLATRHGATVVDVLEFHQSRFDDAKAADVERRVLERIAKGDVDVVAAWALDRVSRRGPLKAMLFLQALEDHHRVQFISLQEPFLSTAGDQTVRGLLLPIMAWVAEQESRRKSERLKAKAKTKRAHAEAAGGRAKWGQGVMANSQDVATVVALRGKGLSLRKIAAEVGLSLASVQRICKAEGV